MSWKTYKIDEIKAKGKYTLVGGPFGSNLTTRDYVEEGVPVLRGSNLSTQKRFTHEDLVFVSEEKAKKLTPNLAFPKDIMFTQRGTLGQVGLIPEGVFERYVVSQSQMKLTVNPEMALPEFVYYFFSTDEGRRNLEAHSITSGVPHINLGILKNLEIQLPPLPTQQKIASILSVYDDLIENNLKRIRLLEEAAQHLYREWFVRFRFPATADRPSWEAVRVVDGLPDGWEFKRADEVFEIKIGKTPPRNESEWFENGKSEIKWVSIRDMNLSSVFVLETSESITIEGVNKFNMNIAPLGTVILSFKLTVGAVAIVNEDMVTNEAIAHFNILDCDAMNSFFTYCYLKNFNFESLGNTSSIGNAINSKIVKSMPFLLPDKTVVKDFGDVATDFFAQIKNLLLQNQRLKEGRDLLLPRLMSGVLEV